MRAHFGLPSVEGEIIEGKPPIQVKFEIPYFTTSGIQVNICASLLQGSLLIDTGCHEVGAPIFKNNFMCFVIVYFLPAQ